MHTDNIEGPNEEGRYYPTAIEPFYRFGQLDSNLWLSGRLAYIALDFMREIGTPADDLYPDYLLSGCACATEEEIMKADDLRGWGYKGCIAHGAYFFQLAGDISLHIASSRSDSSISVLGPLSVRIMTFREVYAAYLKRTWGFWRNKDLPDSDFKRLWAMKKFLKDLDEMLETIYRLTFFGREKKE